MIFWIFRISFFYKIIKFKKIKSDKEFTHSFEWREIFASLLLSQNNRCWSSLSLFIKVNSKSSSSIFQRTKDSLHSSIMSSFDIFNHFLIISWSPNTFLSFSLFHMIIRLLRNKSILYSYNEGSAYYHDNWKYHHCLWKWTRR